MPEIEQLNHEDILSRLSAAEQNAADALRIARAAELAAPVLRLPSSPDSQSPCPQSATLNHPGGSTLLPMGHASATDIRHFGVVVTAFDEVLPEALARQNLLFLQNAIDWSAQTGGVVQLPAGSVDIHGTAIWRLGAGIRGAGKHSSRIIQRCVPLSDSEPFADLLACPPVEGPNGGNGYTLLSDLILDGGWNLRNHTGRGSGPNWSFDPARMTQCAVGYDTPAKGPSAGSASRDAGSDAHNRLDNVTITNVAGCGIRMSGRGENFIRGVELRKCARTGLLLDSPDCFISDVTSYIHGDCGIIITGRAGNLRFSNSKLWFTGMQRDVEPIGAGVYLPDHGTSTLTMTNISTQDTWGPGLHLAGSVGISFHGDLDEAGGGRLEQQGFGYRGPRSLPRCFIRAAGTLRRARIQAEVKGGGRVPTPPHLLDITGSGVLGCDFRLGGDLSGIHADRILESSGSRNARRHNEVWFGTRLLHGHVSAQQLQDPAHGVNDPDYGPSIAYTTDGRQICRAEDGSWRDPATDSGVTVLAFEPWDETGFQAALTHHAGDPNVWVVRYAEA